MEQLLGRDYAVVAEPQTFDTWRVDEQDFLRFLNPPPVPTEAMWGGVNNRNVTVPWTRRASAQLGQPAPELAQIHWPLLLFAVLALYAITQWWH